MILLTMFIIGILRSFPANVGTSVWLPFFLDHVLRFPDSYVPRYFCVLDTVDEMWWRPWLLPAAAGCGFCSGRGCATAGSPHSAEAGFRIDEVALLRCCLSPRL